MDPSYSVAQSTSPEQSRYEPEIDWTNLQRSTFFRRYRLDQFGIWWLMGIFLLLAFCSKDEKVELETQTGEMLPPVRTVTVPPDELPFDQDPQRLGMIVEDLFGDGSRFADIERDDREFAQTLAFQVGFDGYDPDEARTHIRAEILRVRPVISHADLILASEVYLGWLEKARSIGSAECRNVYSRAFDNGGPIMGDAAMLKERELARRFVRMRNFSRRTEGGTSIMLPEWVIENVERQSGIGRETLGEALSDPEHPLRCDATIALLEVILAQPDDDAIDALAAL